MMKRVLIFLTVFALIFGMLQPIKAQEAKKWNCRLGIGYFSAVDLVSAIGMGLAAIETEEEPTNTAFIPLLNPNFELSYRINDWLDLNVQTAFGFSFVKSRDIDGRFVEYTSLFYPSLTLGARTEYWKNDRITLYGSYALGINLIAYYDNHIERGQEFMLKVIPMANIYPLGIASCKERGWFLEVGAGAKGFVNVGGFWSF